MLGRVTRRLLGDTAAAIDRAATLLVQAHSGERAAATRYADHAERIKKLRALGDSYPESLTDHFFRAPRPILPIERELKAFAAGMRCVDLAWPSNYEPFLETVAERYLRTQENHVARARLFTKGAPRPIAILIHGYMGGRFKVEERLWNVRRFLHIGLDVALFTLPFHALRADPARRGRPEFPGNDPRLTNEGFRQTIGDLLDLIRWLRSRGHAEVGVMGMSLGGYTAALAATVDPDLAFLVPVIPLATLADFAAEQGRLSRVPAQAHLEHALLERAYRIVSPLQRVPRIAPERTLVVGAKADRITPVRHARRLAAHFGSPLAAWHGGHLLQFGRAEAFRRIEALLCDLGLAKRE